MKTTMARTPNVRSQIGRTAIALGLAVLLGAAYAAPASADNNDQRGRNDQRDNNQRDNNQRYNDQRGRHVQQAQHQRDQSYHRDNRSYSYDRPADVYAPPPVYYTPPSGPPVLNFVFPLRFH
jgi:hypothetical protein